MDNVSYCSSIKHKPIKGKSGHPDQLPEIQIHKLNHEHPPSRCKPGQHDQYPCGCNGFVYPYHSDKEVKHWKCRIHCNHTYEHRHGTNQQCKVKKSKAQSCSVGHRSDYGWKCGQHDQFLNKSKSVKYEQYLGGDYTSEGGGRQREFAE